MTAHKEKLGIKSLIWPGNSPDLNPIENLWHNIGRKITKKSPKSVLELQTVIESVWNDESTNSDLKNLYESMPRRIEAVIKARGGCTKY